MTDKKGENSPVSTMESTSCNCCAMALRRIWQRLSNLAISKWPISPFWNGSATCPDSTTGYECSICLEKISLEEKISLQCSHVFHSECLAPWMIQDGRCPVCREVYNFQSEHRVLNGVIDNPGINMRFHNGCIDVSHDNGCFMKFYSVNIDERVFKDAFKNHNNGGIDIILDDGGFMKLNNITDWYEEGDSLRINGGTIAMKMMNVAITHRRRDGDDVRMILDNGSFININVNGFILTYKPKDREDQ